MNYLRKSSRTVKGRKVTTWKADFEHFNILEAEVGTTGFEGGDTGHGGRTYFRLKNGASTDMVPRCTEDEVEIKFGGDAELKTFVEALEFSLNTLKKQIEENKQKKKSDEL